MAEFSHYAVQAALHAVLNSDAPLMEQVSGVFDFVPPRTAFPYVTIGDMRATDVSTMTEAMSRLDVTLHIYSRAKGRKEASDIMGRVHAVLHDSSPDVDGFSWVDMRYSGSEIRLERDGVTYHAVMRFAVLVQHD